MQKATLFITRLYLVLNIFQMQAASEDTRAAVGIGLFTSSVLCVKIAQAWNKFQNQHHASSIPSTPSTIKPTKIDGQKIKPLEQIQNNITQAHHINLQDREQNQPRYVNHSSNYSYIIASQNNNIKTPLYNINQSIQGIENKNKEEISAVASECFEHQSLIQRAIMDSLSSHYPTEEHQRYYNFHNKELQRKAKDAVIPKLNCILDQKSNLYKHDKNPKLLKFTEEWHQIEDEAKRRLLILEELKPLARLDNSIKLQNFLSKNVSNIETSQAERAMFFGETQNASHAHAITISTERTFIPKNSSTNQIIYIPVIHGTFAKKGKSFGDDETHPITESMILYAQRMALEKNSIIKLLVVKWSGEWDEKARIESGQNLANKLNAIIAEEKKNPHANVSVQVIAHSYGCDVARIMIQKASEDIQFDRAFFLASPPTKINVSHRVQDFHIYGDLDGIATAEAWRLSHGTATSIHNSLAYANIRAKIEGEDLNHKSIKNIIRYLHEIPTITENYPGESAFIVNIDNQVPAAIFNENNNQDEDELDLQDIPDDIQYNMVALIDKSNRNATIPLTEDINTKDIIAQDQVKQIHPLVNLYDKRSYQDAFDSEVKSAGGQDSCIKTILVNCIGLFETIFGRSSSSPIASETTSESTTPSRSPVNQSRHTTPPIESQFAQINYSDIEAQIAEAKANIINENSFEGKSILIAMLSSQINQYENDKAQNFFRDTLKKSLEKEAHEVMAWQYNYEWIIGKTRTAPNPLWTLQETEQLQYAQTIYQRLKLHQNEELQTLFAGYEILENPIQQALLSAIKQGLKLQDIENQARIYLESKNT